METCRTFFCLRFFMSTFQQPLGHLPKVLLTINLQKTRIFFSLFADMNVGTKDNLLILYLPLQLFRSEINLFAPR